MNLKNILVLCGGQSTEHDISLLSARNVIENLDSKKYAVSVVLITHDDTWNYFATPAEFFSHSHSHSHSRSHSLQITRRFAVWLRFTSNATIDSASIRTF
jgi:D-alanine-D-alanine ligase and related ATP-grasp enzymes